jgi:acetolactate synthase-1/2/3 large subunit
MIYAGNRVTSALGDPVSEVKPASGNSSPYPDFLAIATGYRIKAERVTMLSQLDAAIGRMLSDLDEPYLLDVLVERDDNVYPMIPAGKTYRDVVFDASGGGVSDT